MNKAKSKEMVRAAYGKIARGQGGCGCGTCAPTGREFAQSIGYSEEELSSAPDEANLALGCGNPTALAGLKEGEIVLDLGSGAGFDCFLAAGKVGPKGRVIGVDMTPEMVEKARGNARGNGFENVEFRLGEIENLPVGDNSVDAVISNCVINLSVEKPRVFHEIYRVLKPGGRAAISDIALLKELPQKVRENIDAYVGCIGGAVLIEDYEGLVRSSGLRDVKVTVQRLSPCIDPNTKDPIGRAILDAIDGESIFDYVASVFVEGRK
jgi:SAM-dependent methyltransferase